MGLMVVIEGLVCAGKTTLLNKLGQLVNYRTIPEYKKYLKDSEKLPRFPPSSRKEALLASRFFIILERRRQNDLVKLSEQDVIVVFDRGISSCLAFEYVARKFTGFDTYLEVIQMYQVEDFYQPHLYSYLYLDISYETMIDRMKRRGTFSGNHFADRKFTELLVEFYRHFLVLSQFIKINGELSEQEVFNQALTAITNCQIEREPLEILEIARRLA